jgi:hypothetical protein
VKLHEFENNIKVARRALDGVLLNLNDLEETTPGVVPVNGDAVKQLLEAHTALRQAEQLVAAQNAD